MYWIWLFFTSPNEYLLDRSLGLVTEGTDWNGALDVGMSYDALIFVNMMP